MNHKDNRIVVDLSKVQWAIFGYRNQDNDWRDRMIGPTVHNIPFNETQFVFGTKHTMLEYAMKHKLIDIWIPELKLKVTANCILVYTGDKAKSLYKAFRERQFNRKKK